MIFIKPETKAHYKRNEDKHIEFRSTEEMSEFFETYYCILDEIKYHDYAWARRAFETQVYSDKYIGKLEELVELMLKHSYDNEDDFLSLNNAFYDINMVYKSGLTNDVANSRNAYQILFNTYMLEMLVKENKKCEGAIRSYFKFKVTSYLAEIGIRDMIRVMITEGDSDLLYWFSEVVNKIIFGTNYSNSLIIVPEEIYDEESVYETYAKLLEKRRVTQKYSMYRDILSIIAKHMNKIQILNNEWKKKNVSNIDDAELSRALTGRRKSNFKKQRKTVIKIIKWFNEEGPFHLSSESAYDFKSVYDAVFMLKVNNDLKNKGIDIGINSIKNEGFEIYDCSFEQKVYIIFAVLILYMYNNPKYGTTTLNKNINLLDRIMERNIQCFDVGNYDSILILMTAFNSYCEKELCFVSGIKPYYG